ncbi:MAG: hypothetical protein ACOYMN_16910, partial [Roseimicrobium sp.]
MRYFCTYFDAGYLARGLALHDSLLTHAGELVLYVLCLDEAVFSELTRLNLDHVQPLALSELEQHDAKLLAVKASRPGVEYFFTMTPSLPALLLEKQPDIDLITYLDADLFFYSSCEPLFAEADDADVAIIAHRFPPERASREIYGRFNVGWVSFRRSANGLACLAWWRERCLEWCHDRYENGRFADQKYLDEFTARFQGVHVLEHPGANVAPWNLVEDELSLVDGNVQVSGKPLVFYHFHGIERVSDHIIDTGLSHYGLLPGPISGEHIYKPYFQQLLSNQASPIATLRRKHRPDGKKASASATITLAPAAPTGVVGELDAALRAAQEGKHAQVREDQRVILEQEASIRASEAGGLWLRHSLTFAGLQRKTDSVALRQAEKALEKQKEATDWATKHPLRILWNKFAKECKRAFRTKQAKTPLAGQPKTKLSKDEKRAAERAAWLAAPAEVLALWSDLGCAYDAAFAAPLLDTLAAGQRCLICHASTRGLAVASLLSVKALSCTVMGCPGWLKKESTKCLKLEMEALRQRLCRDSEFISGFDIVIADTDDLEWLRPVLQYRLWPRQKVLLLCGEWDGASGLGSGYHELSPGLTYFPAPPREMLHPDWQYDPRVEPTSWPRAAVGSRLFADVTPSGRPWPKITVVTVTRNQAQYLAATLDSVLAQAYPSLEYLVLDGAST